MQAHEYIEWYNKQEAEGWKEYSVSSEFSVLAEKVFEIAREAYNARAALSRAAYGHAKDMQDLQRRTETLSEDPAVNLHGEDQEATTINRLTVQFHCYNRMFNSLKGLVLPNE